MVSCRIYFWFFGSVCGIIPSRCGVALQEGSWEILCPFHYTFILLGLCRSRTPGGFPGVGLSRLLICNFTFSFSCCLYATFATFLWFVACTQLLQASPVACMQLSANCSKPFLFLLCNFCVACMQLATTWTFFHKVWLFVRSFASSCQWLFAILDEQ